jgi:hypothetical protein
MEPFGAQNTLDSFLRTEQPGIGRWPSGSGPGGWQVLCPQASIQIQDPGTINHPWSATLLVAGPHVSFGAGTIDTSTGAMHDGWAWGEDNGALTFTDYSVGVGSDEFQLTPTGDVAFQAGTGDWGTLTHNITAPQTWTFPDASGTVALASGLYGGEALADAPGGTSNAAANEAAVYTYTLAASGDQTIDMVAGTQPMPHGALGQRMTIQVASDAAAERTITFGAFLKSTGDLTTPPVAGATVSVDFVSDGNANWVESGRQTSDP